MHGMRIRVLGLTVLLLTCSGWAVASCNRDSNARDSAGKKLANKKVAKGAVKPKHGKDKAGSRLPELSKSARAARDSALRKRVRKTVQYRTSGSPGPNTLAAQTYATDLIVVGRVSDVFRETYTPIGTTDTTFIPQTVYTFQVEQYLKGSGPSTIKVHQLGAILGATYFQVSGDPRLNVADRYILFLRRFVVDENYGGVPVFRGEQFAGISAYADEYNTMHGYGEVLLRSGQTWPNEDPFDRAEALTFSDGDQIIGVTEEQAVASIQAAVDRERMEFEPPSDPEE